MTAIFLIFLILSHNNAFAFSLSADEMYRNLLNYENDSPPDIIVNRKSPEINSFDNEFVETEILDEKPEVKDKNLEEIYDKIIKEKQQQQEIEWKNTVKAIQTGKATAFDIEKIKNKSDLNDADATELLAWMYTTGSGVPQNLVKAYGLYKKATALGIKDANKNASLIYKSMSVTEREKISNF